MTPQVRRLITADGGGFAVTRLGDGPRATPVVLVPGLCTGRRFWLSDSGTGLAAHLAQHGFACWIVERRGIGHARTATGAARPGLDEHLRHDLPALQRIIAAEAGRPAFWVGHSFGGVLCARAAATSLVRDEVAGLVLLASQVELGLRTLVPPIGRLLTASTRSIGRFPARALRVGSDDEPPAAIDDACRWTTAARHDPAFLDDLADVDVASIAVVGAGDSTDPPPGCRRFHARLGGTDRTFLVAGIDTGYAEDYDHAGLVVSKHAQQEIWPLLTEWMTARA